MSIKNDGHYFCRAGGNRPDGLNEPVTVIATTVAYGMPEETGSYSMDVEPGIYRVTLNTEGYR
ncbi:prophage tail fiber N-terminal domain-containing protein, partial [Escherichia coli]|uniref:prophage tail fiber N-terminal domain-containing protein n=1 Tax=Escherichia coli TaxID=562 RepID=UPI0021B1A5B2